MARLFYDHIVVIEEITSVLATYDIPEKEKNELLKQIDELVHHHVFDTILTHLPKEHHELFLEKFIKEPHNTDLLGFLSGKIAVDIEKEIRKTALVVKRALLKEIKRHSQNK